MKTSKELIDKLRMYGEDNLTSEELLALIIGETSSDKSAIKIAEELIEKNKELTNNLRFLHDISVEQLMEIDGVDEVIATRLKAISGISKQFGKQITAQTIVIESSKDIADLFMEELRYEKKELIKIVILNTKNIVQKVITLSKGTAHSATVTARDVLAEPLKMNAPKFVLVHNHPSGDSKPSEKDLEASRIIYNCAGAMGIELLDHIVIGNGTFQSAL